MTTSALIVSMLATVCAAPESRAATTSPDASTPATSASPPVSPLDAMLACGKQVFKRPVYITSDSRYITLRFPCPSTPAAFAEAVGREELRVVESETSVILTPEWRYTHPRFKYEWTRATVQTEVVQGSVADERARKLTPEQLDAAVKAIFEAARTPPLGTVPNGTAGETVSMEVELDVVVLPLRADVASVVALWGQPGGFRRLVYGELVDGRYVFKWDSPIMSGRSATLSYADVDGDGAAEMTITSFAGRDAMKVSIFSIQGRELTRQVDCPNEWSNRASDRASVACPVVGTELTIEDASNGKRALRVDNEDGSFRMILKNGRYVRTSK